MLVANGYDPATLAEYVIAPQYLRRPQIDSLYRENPETYRLITRDGSAYNPLQPTIAMADSLLGKRVLVENPRTGKSIEVRVTDTGAFDDETWARKRGVPRRIADLSKGAADAIGHNGLEDVIITLRN
jgi:rare lipoprotein A (peptidoglycan hydrolase)